MGAFVRLLDSMQDLRTATLVRDLDGNALPARSRILSTIQCYIASRGPPSTAVAMNLRRPHRSQEANSAPVHLDPCYACREMPWSAATKPHCQISMP